MASRRTNYLRSKLAIQKIETEMAEDTISLETSMGTAIAVQVAPMTWEVTYPWKEERTIIGPARRVTAQISRYIGRVDLVFM
jgi:hypothetical protein